MRNFVEQGGIWVLGPLSACRTPEATAHRDACYSADFETWLGVHVPRIQAALWTALRRWWRSVSPQTANQPEPSS